MSVDEIIFAPIPPKRKPGCLATPEGLVVLALSFAKRARALKS